MDPIDAAIAAVIVVVTTGGVWIVGTLAKGLVTKWTQPKEVRGVDPEDIEELREAIGQLAGEMSEVHERLDFAERMITAGRTPEREVEP